MFILVVPQDTRSLKSTNVSLQTVKLKLFKLRLQKQKGLILTNDA